MQLLDSPRSLLLWLQFDGGQFSGFQRQIQGVRTVAGTLEAAWSAMLDEQIVAKSSSRTDAGVHARRMPVLVRTHRDVPARGILLGLNRHLPDDMAVQEAHEMPDDFDVRNDAVGKRYIYRIALGEARQPLLRQNHWHLRGPLDLASMQRAAQDFAGIHDFSSFRGAACVAKSTIRHLRAVTVAQPRPDRLEIEVDGNAFLLNMVRIIVGTLVEIGRGKRTADCIPALLGARDRTQSGQTAPAHGLTLDGVFYGPAGARQGLNYKDLLVNMAASRRVMT